MGSTSSSGALKGVGYVEKEYFMKCFFQFKTYNGAQARPGDLFCSFLLDLHSLIFCLSTKVH